MNSVCVFALTGSSISLGPTAHPWWWKTNHCDRFGGGKMGTKSGDKYLAFGLLG